MPFFAVAVSAQYAFSVKMTEALNAWAGGSDQRQVQADSTTEPPIVVAEEQLRVEASSEQDAETLALRLFASSSVDHGVVDPLDIRAAATAC